MFISFYIDHAGNVPFLTSKSRCSELIFGKPKSEPLVPEIALIEAPEVKTEQETKLAIAKHLWGEYENTPLCDDFEDCLIDEKFLHFPVETSVYDILNWFEDRFSLSVAEDLMNIKGESTCLQ